MTLDSSWRPMEDGVRSFSRALAALAAPVRERRFTHSAYSAFLGRLQAAGAAIVPLRDLRARNGRVPVVGVRHDVDTDLDAALRMARVEHGRGVRSTYFLLHSAAYWERCDVVDVAREIERLGHEIGLHHDLATGFIAGGAQPADVLAAALGRLRAGGLDVRGAAAHGSFVANRAGVDNNYVFEGWDDRVAGLPNVDRVPKLDPAAFGLEYEAYHLDYDRYFSDALFDGRGRRWHPDMFEASTLRPGEATVFLIHPCHWHGSLTEKSVATYGRVARRVAYRLARLSTRGGTRS